MGCVNFSYLKLCYCLKVVKFFEFPSEFYIWNVASRLISMLHQLRLGVFWVSKVLCNFMQGIQNDLYVDIRYLLPEPWVQVCDNGYISALGSVRSDCIRIYGNWIIESDSSLPKYYWGVKDMMQGVADNKATMKMWAKFSKDFNF